MSLQQEVDKFKAWAATYPIQERSGEWECDYSDWDTFHKAVLSFLASSSPEDWSDTEVSNLLYAIARDNEIEYLVKQVAKNSETLLRLSNLAVSSSEADAKWQLAVQLGALSSRVPEAETLLLKFVNDEDEYVSRRALLSLGALKSSRAEALAERAWDTGHQYQRIAALWVLKEISSDKLPVYVKKAEGKKEVEEWVALWVRKDP
jgi:HEAT repeats